MGLQEIRYSISYKKAMGILIDQLEVSKKKEINTKRELEEERYNEIARQDFKRKIYEECDKEDKEGKEKELSKEEKWKAIDGGLKPSRRY